VDQVVASANKHLPRGSRIVVRGQVLTMRSSTRGLIGGLLFAIVLVYLLIVVNFQSWLDPFVIIAGLPAALTGIVWFLFLTGTHISVPALTGSIMCMGVATANSILVVSFAREEMVRGSSAVEAAMIAGFTRFRPVLMTALAMIIGMLPMALGIGGLSSGVCCLRQPPHCFSCQSFSAWCMEDRSRWPNLLRSKSHE
jgi:multidrug efflux pump subunit AcrB